MKRVLTVFSGFVAVLAVIGIASVSGVSTTVHASDTAKAKVEPKKEEVKKVATDYTYTANEGDSYTKMVRKAVQTYGIVNGVEFGKARIVYIETAMTQAAGSPDLWVDQKVTIKGSDVQKWADKSLKLSDADVAAWQTYVPYIDFNTNSVGE